MKKILLIAAMLFSIAYAQKQNINKFPILDTCGTEVKLLTIKGERLTVYRYVGTKSFVCDPDGNPVYIMRREDISAPIVQAGKIKTDVAKID